MVLIFDRYLYDVLIVQMLLDDDQVRMENPTFFPPLFLSYKIKINEKNFFFYEFQILH